MVLLSDLATEIVIPSCAVVGIVFSLNQWVLVSRVKLSSDLNSSGSGPPTNNNNGCNDYLIAEEEGINDHDVVVKCAEIQSAISEDFNDIAECDRLVRRIVRPLKSIVVYL
ncbi:hypothetical protein RHGRI_035188 [Rhododendron griersonianum]|uniref:H(+)-exporting diphosphatase n=1 Tax=Rhododendron griersonianum TaxID=479676 RepID=A0AAV6I7H0_9ERIC|nr:hypothetical protein RHGRI_035188 [Rhododendron griersonianum]